MKVKVTVIGGGSTYTPELVKGFLQRAEQFPLGELWLMDIDAKRLEIVGEFARRMVAAKGMPFKVVLTQERQAALEAATYVITQLRVGQMPARRADEYLGKRHGLIGQETIGVGGMAKALRTIPVILDIAREMRTLAPKAMLVNFTNPAGLITQALSQYAPDILSVGVCNVPITTKMSILQRLEKIMGGPIDPERATLKTLGLNHLSWHYGFTLDGKDIWPTIIQDYIATLEASLTPEWEPHLIQSLQMIPNYYLHYYYHTGRMLTYQDKWPPSRAEEVMEVEKELLRQYADSRTNELPEGLMKRGGAYYSTVATQLLNAHFNDLGEIHVVNVPNKGAVKEWPEDWVLEIPARVDSNGIHPLPAKPLPPLCFGLLAQVKSYELLTVEAGVHGDRNAAYQALLAHPLGPGVEKVRDVLEDMLETNRPYLPQFWTK